MKFQHLVVAAISAIFLSGCATPEQIAKQPVTGKFESSLSAKALANCIDNNAENMFYAGAFRSKVRDTGSEPIKVIVYSNAEYVAAVVEVTSANKGSIALFRFGGAAEFDEGISPGSVLKKFVTKCE